MGLCVPVPEAVPVPADRILLDHHSALELVVDEDMPRVIEGWETCLESGSAVVTARSASDPRCTITMHVLDARARFGVYLCVVTGLPGDTGDQAPPRAMGPRVAHIRKNERAVMLGIDGALTRLLGWTEQELVGRRALELVHPDDQVRGIANWMGMLQTPDEQVRVRLRHQHADGRWIWFEVTNTNRLDDPRFGDVVGEMIEIADEMAAEEALRAHTRLLQRLTESLPMGVAQLDRDRVIVYRNERLDEILGARAARLDEQLAGLDERSRVEALAAVETALRDDADLDLEVEVRSGQRCALTVRPLDDDAGTVTGAVLTVTDITESVRLRDQLERRATYDELTGLSNRATVLAELQARLAERRNPRAGVAVVFVDLDRFKAVNDELGHAAGDRLLVATARRLQHAVRDGDLVGRIGGDEFLVIASGVCSSAEALRVGDRVAAALLPAGDEAAGELSATASIGVAFTCEQLAPDALVAAADAAMYVAKAVRDGRPVLGDIGGDGS
jgi:diguanylate cyclase (GGDEF)-like protein/PAS domain S-box-containing protein